MNAPAPSSAADEINRLHAEVLRCAADSRKALSAALAAAWHAGTLLRAERKQINTRRCRGAWRLWVCAHFRGSFRTTQRYMRLAASISDPSFLEGLSLRQAYFRLGIATEPKKRRQHAVTPLPPCVRLAARLVCALNRSRNAREFAERYRRDLLPLYERLCSFYADANQSAGCVSKSP